MMLEVWPTCVNLVAGFNDPVTCWILDGWREWAWGRTDKSQVETVRRISVAVIHNK